MRKSYLTESRIQLSSGLNRKMQFIEYKVPIFTYNIWPYRSKLIKDIEIPQVQPQVHRPGIYPSLSTVKCLAQSFFIISPVSTL